MPVESDALQYIRQHDSSFPDGASPAMILVLGHALAERSATGKATTRQLESLLARGYNPDLALTLSWAHAEETLRLLGVDNVHTSLEAP